MNSIGREVSKPGPAQPHKLAFEVPVILLALISFCLNPGMLGADDKLPRTSPFGDVIRARSEARILDQIANQQAIKTRRMKVENYWHLKRLGQREHSRDFAKKRAARERYLQTKGSGAPPKLAARDLDPFSGKINWPTTFQSSTYASERRKLDALFSERARTGNRKGMAQEITSNCDALGRKLRKNLKSMPSSEYLAAKKFVRSLKDEHRRL